MLAKNLNNNHSRKLFSPLLKIIYEHSVGDFCLDDEEFEYYQTLKKEWEQSLQDFDPIEVFPEAKKLYKEKLKREIEQAEADLIRANEIETEFLYKIDTTIPSKEQEFWKNVLEVVYVNPLREGREKIIKQNRFKLSKHETSSSGINDDDIARAKSVPIETFLKFNASGFAKCVFHEERTASLKYYPKQNSWYCFSCHAGGSVVDFIMKRDNVPFLTAVKNLCNG